MLLSFVLQMRKLKPWEVEKLTQRYTKRVAEPGHKPKWVAGEAALLINCSCKWLLEISATTSFKAYGKKVHRQASGQLPAGSQGLLPSLAPTCSLLGLSQGKAAFPGIFLLWSPGYSSTKDVVPHSPWQGTCKFLGHASHLGERQVSRFITLSSEGQKVYDLKVQKGLAVKEERKQNQKENMN